MEYSLFPGLSERYFSARLIALITPPQKPDCLSISTLIAIGNLLKNPEFPLNQSLKPDYLLLERKIGIVQNESVGRTA